MSANAFIGFDLTHKIAHSALALTLQWSSGINLQADWGHRLSCSSIVLECVAQGYSTVTKLNGPSGYCETAIHPAAPLSQRVRHHSSHLQILAALIWLGTEMEELQTRLLNYTFIFTLNCFQKIQHLPFTLVCLLSRVILLLFSSITLNTITKWSRMRPELVS